MPEEAKPETLMDMLQRSYRQSLSKDMDWENACYTLIYHDEARFPASTQEIALGAYYGITNAKKALKEAVDLYNEAYETQLVLEEQEQYFDGKGLTSNTYAQLDDHDGEDDIDDYVWMVLVPVFPNIEDWFR